MLKNKLSLSYITAATKMVVKDSTNKEVEDYIKRWLLSYMDRIRPRPRTEDSGRNSPKPQRSPMKRKRHFN